MRNIIRAPRVTNDFRAQLKATYNASLMTLQGFWVVVEASVGLYVGRFEAVNPDHGDVLLNSVERVDVRLTADKVWIRGNQVKQLLLVDKHSKDRAMAVANKMLPQVFERRGEDL